MRIAFTADWHARGKDLESFYCQLNAMRNECMRKSVDTLIVVGDVFDRPTIGDSHASTGAIASVIMGFFSDCYESGISVIAIPGNHDAAGVGSKDALYACEELDGVNVFHGPEVIYNNLIALVPWSWDSSKSAEQVITELLDKNGPVQILVGHMQVVGMRMNGVATCPAKPGTWQVRREFLDQLIESGRVKKIVLGDFHARQPYYVGALRQLNFGEEGNPAGYEIYDTFFGESEWIDLDAAPRYKTTVINEPDQLLDPMPEDKRTINRVRFGFAPDAATVRHLESCGVAVEQVVDVAERTQRADVPEGIISRPHDLIDLWAASQTPPIADGRLSVAHAIFDRINADKSKEAANVTAQS